LRQKLVQQPLPTFNKSRRLRPHPRHSRTRSIDRPHQEVENEVESLTKIIQPIPGHVINVSLNGLARVIEKGRYVVYFTGGWKKNKNQLGLVFERLANEYPIGFVKVNITTTKSDIPTFPTFKIFEDGNEVETLEVGTEQELIEMIRRHI